MTDSLRPLLDGDDPSHVSDVLRAGLDDDPSMESYTRAARQLGLGSAVALSAATATAGASQATAAGASSGLVAIAKWFALGVLMGGVVSTPLVFDSEATPPAEAGRQPVAQPAVASARAPFAPVDAVPRREEVPPLALPAPSRAPNARAFDSTSAPTTSVQLAPSVASFSAPSPSSLEKEVATLDSARRALESGSANGALAMLDRYAREPLPHSLAAEAEQLRVRALMASGRIAEAQRIANAVLAARGTDGYACRLAKLASVPTVGCPEAASR